MRAALRASTAGRPTACEPGTQRVAGKLRSPPCTLLSPPRMSGRGCRSRTPGVSLGRVPIGPVQCLFPGRVGRALPSDPQVLSTSSRAIGRHFFGLAAPAELCALKPRIWPQPLTGCVRPAVATLRATWLGCRLAGTSQFSRGQSTTAKIARHGVHFQSRAKIRFPHLAANGPLLNVTPPSTRTSDQHFWHTPYHVLLPASTAWGRKNLTGHRWATATEDAGKRSSSLTLTCPAGHAWCNGSTRSIAAPCHHQRALLR